MSKFTKEDIDDFFERQVFIYGDNDRVTAYRNFMHNKHKKIQAIHFHKLQDNYRIYVHTNDSYFTVNKEHSLHERLFEHVVEFKLTGSDMKFKIHFLDDAPLKPIGCWTEIIDE